MYIGLTLHFFIFHTSVSAFIFVFLLVTDFFLVLLSISQREYMQFFIKIQVEKRLSRDPPRARAGPVR
jgi:hypothetical protein